MAVGRVGAGYKDGAGVVFFTCALSVCPCINIYVYVRSCMYVLVCLHVSLHLCVYVCSCV